MDTLRKVLARLLPDPIASVRDDGYFAAARLRGPVCQRAQALAELAGGGQRRIVGGLRRPLLVGTLVADAQLHLAPEAVHMDHHSVHRDMQLLRDGPRRLRLGPTLFPHLFPQSLLPLAPLLGQLLSCLLGDPLYRTGGELDPADQLQLPSRQRKRQIAGEPARQRPNVRAALAGRDAQHAVDRVEASPTCRAVVIGARDWLLTVQRHHRTDIVCLVARLGSAPTMDRPALVAAPAGVEYLVLDLSLDLLAYLLDRSLDLVERL